MISLYSMVGLSEKKNGVMIILYPLFVFTRCLSRNHRARKENGGVGQVSPAQHPHFFRKNTGIPIKPTIEVINIYVPEI